MMPRVIQGVVQSPRARLVTDEPEQPSSGALSTLPHCLTTEAPAMFVPPKGGGSSNVSVPMCKYESTSTSSKMLTVFLLDFF